MGKILFGYQLGTDVQLNIPNKYLINHGLHQKNNHQKTAKLRETKLRLLVYLLNNSNCNVIMNSKIMFNVWDKYGLRSSAPRLWQVMRDLQLTLSQVGLDEDFITKVDSKGYKVKNEIVSALYYDKLI